MGLDMYLHRYPKFDSEETKEKMRTMSDKVNTEEEARLFLIDYTDNPDKYIHHFQYINAIGIGERIGYWRKANQIHSWFVKNVQDGEDDCNLYEVSERQLKALLDLCERVLKSTQLISGKVQNGYTIKQVNGEIVKERIIEEGKYLEDATVADKLLPTEEGFFFGSTHYDEWYWKDLEDTVKLLSKVLEETDFEKESITYQSSW